MSTIVSPPTPLDGKMIVIMSNLTSFTETLTFASFPMSSSPATRLRSSQPTSVDPTLRIQPPSSAATLSSKFSLSLWVPSHPASSIYSRFSPLPPLSNTDLKSTLRGRSPARSRQSRIRGWSRPRGKRVRLDTHTQTERRNKRFLLGKRPGDRCPERRESGG